MSTRYVRACTYTSARTFDDPAIEVQLVLGAIIAGGSRETERGLKKREGMRDNASNSTTSTGTMRNDVRLVLEDGRTSAALSYASLLLQLSVD